jgi:hypothetical protein
MLTTTTVSPIYQDGHRWEGAARYLLPPKIKKIEKKEIYKKLQVILKTCSPILKILGLSVTIALNTLNVCEQMFWLQPTTEEILVTSMIINTTLV